MDTMLNYLAGYSIDHHSRAIIDIIPFCIEKQLPSLLPYIDSRLQQTEAVRKITKGCLKDGSNGITELNLLFGQKEYESKLMKSRAKGDDSLIDRPIRAEFIDLPGIYHYKAELFEDFYGALADTD